MAKLPQPIGVVYDTIREQCQTHRCYFLAYNSNRDFDLPNAWKCNCKTFRKKVLCISINVIMLGGFGGAKPPQPTGVIYDIRYHSRTMSNISLLKPPLIHVLLQKLYPFESNVKHIVVKTLPIHVLIIKQYKNCKYYVLIDGPLATTNREYYVLKDETCRRHLVSFDFIRQQCLTYRCYHFIHF